MKPWKLLIGATLIAFFLGGCSILGLDSDDDTSAYRLPAPENTVLVLSSTGKYISAYDYKSGKLLKKNFVELEEESSAVNFWVTEDKILVAATSYNALLVYDLNYGTKLQEIKLSDNAKPSHVAASGDLAYITTSEGDYNLFKVDLNSYQVQKKAKIGACLQNILIASDGNLYISDIENLYSPQGALLKVDPQELTTLQQWDLSDKSASNPQALVEQNGAIFLACAGISWGENKNPGAILKLENGILSTFYAPSGEQNIYPGALTGQDDKLICSKGFGQMGALTIATNSATASPYGNLDFSVYALDSKGDYCAFSQSNWSSADEKAYLHLYRSEILQAKLECGNDPACLRFVAK